MGSPENGTTTTRSSAMSGGVADSSSMHAGTPTGSFSLGYSSSANSPLPDIKAVFSAVGGDGRVGLSEELFFGMIPKKGAAATAKQLFDEQQPDAALPSAPTAEIIE